MAVKIPGDRRLPVWRRVERWFGEKELRQQHCFARFQEKRSPFLARGVIIARWDGVREDPTHYYRADFLWAAFRSAKDEDPCSYGSFADIMDALRAKRREMQLQLLGLHRACVWAGRAAGELLAALEQEAKQLPEIRIGLALWVYPQYRKFYLPFAPDLLRQAAP